jgi:hypothetical protein
VENLIDAGVGYRLLNDGEIIEKGDELLNEGKWELRKSSVGFPKKSYYYPTRRAIEPAKSKLQPGDPDLCLYPPQSGMPGTFYYEYDGKRYRWNGESWQLYGLPGY